MQQVLIGSVVPVFVLHDNVSFARSRTDLVESTVAICPYAVAIHGRL